MVSIRTSEAEEIQATMLLQVHDELVFETVIVFLFNIFSPKENGGSTLCFYTPQVVTPGSRTMP